MQQWELYTPKLDKYQVWFPYPLTPEMVKHREESLAQLIEAVNNYEKIRRTSSFNATLVGHFIVSILATAPFYGFLSLVPMFVKDPNMLKFYSIMKTYACPAMALLIFTTSAYFTAETFENVESNLKEDPNKLLKIAKQLHNEWIEQNKIPKDSPEPKVIIY